MRLCLFDDNRLGLVQGELVHDVSAALNALPTGRYPLPRHDLLVGALPELRAPILALAGQVPGVPVASVRLRPPVANPGKIVAAPVNYRKHLEEAEADPATFHAAHVRKIEETGLFLKANSSLAGASDTLRLVQPERRTDHEVELAAIIGTRCKDVTRETAMSHVAAYSIGLDITIRGPEERSMRKSPDGYTVLGPWMVTADEIADPAALDLSLDVNGEPRQRANTRDLLLDIPELIVFASRFYTLEPGDIILTGTPEGVGPIRPGDVMQAAIGGIGAITVRVG